MDTARQSRSTKTPLPSTEGTLPPRESAVEAAVIVRPHGGATVAADRSFPIILAGDTKEGVAAAWWRDGIAAIRAEAGQSSTGGRPVGPIGGCCRPVAFSRVWGSVRQCMPDTSLVGFAQQLHGATAPRGHCAGEDCLHTATRLSPRGAMLAFDPPLINPEDITIPTCVPGADEAIALIRRHHEVWLSTQTNFQRV